jgi:hypothetical protein
MMSLTRGPELPKAHRKRIMFSALYILNISKSHQNSLYCRDSTFLIQALMYGLRIGGYHHRNRGGIPTNTPHTPLWNLSVL